ncbi:unnamed protein product [Pedinophyceae sp. YPF-701]|nr:unnamed protein product [Pedinophyceae sp. YPF-701]
MSLVKAELTHQVFQVGLTHALSTESEEIMGLLLGDVFDNGPDGLTCRVWCAVPQIRNDRRRDRVEASPEQVAQCAQVAERIAAATGVATRVIGWYHSHPHITVLPSHVDVRTQMMFQQLDSGFLGIIFSCFNEGGAGEASARGGHIKVTAFQSFQGPSGPERRHVPVELCPARNRAEEGLSDLGGLLRIMLLEEQMAKRTVKRLASTRSSLGASPSDVTAQVASLHASSVYLASSTTLLETFLLALLRVAEDRHRAVEGQLRQIEADKESMRGLLAKRRAQPAAGAAAAAANIVGDLLGDSDHAGGMAAEPGQGPMADLISFGDTPPGSARGGGPAEVRQIKRYDTGDFVGSLLGPTATPRGADVGDQAKRMAAVLSAAAHGAGIVSHPIADADAQRSSVGTPHGHDPQPTWSGERALEGIGELALGDRRHSRGSAVSGGGVNQPGTRPAAHRTPPPPPPQPPRR